LRDLRTHFLRPFETHSASGIIPWLKQLQQNIRLPKQLPGFLRISPGQEDGISDQRLGLVQSKIFFHFPGGFPKQRKTFFPKFQTVLETLFFDFMPSLLHRFHTADDCRHPVRIRIGGSEPPRPVEFRHCLGKFVFPQEFRSVPDRHDTQSFCAFGKIHLSLPVKFLNFLFRIAQKHLAI
ncbi:MAG: hypothetical protein IJS14_15090, partial [Lentisphaeria bacterium]|nr:hypothetical protein [Lentisphaeria bacterium]